MTSRLEKVVHIEVKDFENEIVGAKINNDFSFTCQKEYYFNRKKIKEDKYDNFSNKIILGKEANKKLKREVKKLMNRPFSFIDDEKTVNVVIKGGSTINYSGNNKQKFMKKILKFDEID